VTSSSALRTVVLTTVLAAGFAAAVPPPAASAFPNPLKPICKVAGFVLSGAAGKACGVVQNGGRFLKAGQKLLGGHPGQALKTVLGEHSISGGAVTTALGTAAIGAWVLGGAKAALQETASVLSQSTSPQLRSTWFSATYWRMAAISAVLTLPFLFATAVEAVIRSDLTLLLRAAFGYLPLAMLAVSIAAPLTMLLLAAADELSGVVSSAAGGAGGHFLGRAASGIGTLTLFAGSPFLAFVIGVFTVAGALVLWIELVMREAAVYVIVLMLPLAFAALVWPARRVWATRAVEMLVALILSKFAIVAVLSLGGAAMSSSFGQHSITALIAGLVLLVMGAFTPWALMRLIPLAEIAAGAAGSLRGEAFRALHRPAQAAADAGAIGDAWATSATAEMRRDAEANEPGQPPSASEPPARTGDPGEPDPEDSRASDPEDGGESETMQSGDEPAPAGADLAATNGDLGPRGRRAPGVAAGRQAAAPNPATGAAPEPEDGAVLVNLDDEIALDQLADGTGHASLPIPALQEPPASEPPGEIAEPEPPREDPDATPPRQEPGEGTL
jgi:hypothetical protein